MSVYFDPFSANLAGVNNHIASDWEHLSAFRALAANARDFDELVEFADMMGYLTPEFRERCARAKAEGKLPERSIENTT